MSPDVSIYNVPVIVIIHSKASNPTLKEDCVLAGYNIALMAQALGLSTALLQQTSLV